MTRLFVTGTDTEVGKTHVTATLARLARASGRSVVACKPVASGVAPGTAGEDAALLSAAAGHPPLGFAAFVEAVSPHRAALLEGRALPSDLLDRVAALRDDVVLVEGAGGWRVPLAFDPPWSMVDLARAVGGEVVVVAANRLGVLNHTLLTLEAVRADGCRARAVVLNDASDAPDRSTRWNLEDLRRLTQVPVVHLPRAAAGAARDAAEQALARVILGAVAVA
jgi:dethiobiotin synthetase